MYVILVAKLAVKTMTVDAAPIASALCLLATKVGRLKIFYLL